MQLVATINSLTDHGGHPISSSNDVLAEGQGIVRAGDLHACPITGHGITPFSSSAQTQADGRPVVRQRIDQAGCGAVAVTGATMVEAA